MTRHWTAETDREADVFFATLSVKEIRRRQRLAAAQIELAWEQRNDDALADLRRMENALTRSMAERTVA
jgi:hypothetical protein